MRKFLTFALCGATALGVWSGCSESSVYVDSCDYPQGTGGSGSTASSLVTFVASVESRNMTRALSPVRKNVQAEVYAFPSTATGASNRPIVQGPYLSMTPGTMQGVDGFRMYLPSGNYDFYAISDNTQFAPPKVTDGRSEGLMNGVDYLWWRGLEQDVTSSQAGVPIIFMHCATQVIFELTAAAGVETLNDLVAAHIYPPIEGAQMDLATGVIAVTTAYQPSLSKMNVSGFLAQYTMLPMRSSIPLRVSFDVRINNEPVARTFDVSLPLPDGELKAGNSYRFSAVIEGNQVSFPSVGVTSWVDVDETGRPLYPTEK